MKIKELENHFTGVGEVKGYKFTQIDNTGQAYLYKVCTNGRQAHYEIFKRKLAPICIDFEKRLYSDEEFKEIYPKSKDFGIWAWTTRDKIRACEILNTIT